ncbi:MAG: CxxxxCH/CxxCH domain-containing protein [candidate division Zixibacteria bacterium]|nr:CxxxxCH/CxxCH domain-containing protein [candidate division Zixibacteria bacterium]
MKITIASTLRRYSFAIVLLLTVALVAGCSSEKSNPTLPGAHPDTWMELASADFHGRVALISGLESCGECHGRDFAGGISDVSCYSCHGSGRDNCLACHGGFYDSTGAPPYGLRGETSDTALAVGAHILHLHGSAVSDGVTCQSCHRVPLFAWDAAHLDFDPVQGNGVIDSIAEVIFGDIGTADGAAWDRQSRTCGQTYCHGNFVGGDTTNAPHWTNTNQALCGSCHDVGSDPGSLGWKHEYHVGTAGLSCVECHYTVADSGLQIAGRSLHVNGVVDLAIRDTTLCDDCHGSGTGSCTGCHGGQDNETGAPPAGLRGETSTVTRAVGAHTRHLEGGSVADGFACDVCHVVPQSMLAAGHLGADSIAEVTFSGLAGNQASWDRTANTCASSYCHGNFAGGAGSNNTSWIGGSSEAACGSCHDDGNSPGSLSGNHEKHVTDKNIDCYRCHSTTVNSSNAIIGPTVHVDGVRQVSFSSGHGIWSNNSCAGTGCHGVENWYDTKAVRPE